MSNNGSSQNPIVLFGEYDIERKEELALIFREAEPFDELLIDLNRVEYVDSTFLTELANLRKRNPDAAITLLGPRPHLKKVLQLMSFEKMFRIVDGSEAVSASSDEVSKNAG